MAAVFADAKVTVRAVVITNPDTTEDTTTEDKEDN